MERERIPLLLLAGALGAGKTTLLGRWIGEPAFADTAVVVNELGEHAVDAHVVGGFMGTVRSVAGGCACCTARAALSQALEAVASPRRGTRAPRVAVELAAWGQPAPLLADLRGAALRESFALQGVVAVVDASASADALDDPAARAQVAVADVVLISKAHLAPAATVDPLIARVAAINPDAEILAAEADAGAVWDAAARAAGRERRHVAAALAAIEAGAPDAEMALRTVRLAEPVELSEFCVRLASFLDAHDARVLRVKGLVAVRGRRGPALIQAVGSSLQPVRTLKAWPTPARESALLVIGRGLDLAALESTQRRRRT